MFEICIVGSTIFKCLGHIYEVDNLFVYSHFLVVDKITTIPKIGDILVSKKSDGFIENIVATFEIDGTEYVETKLQRCNEHSRVNITR